MESDPRMDLQLIREGEMERERLQKEGFNMKLRINFLEEQLLKYKEGTAFEDEDFESENVHLRTVIEEKVQELERRNALLVRARDAIEDLRTDLETAKENNRLSASMNQSQLEETVHETQRLEQEVARLEDEVARLRMHLNEANRKYEDLLRAHDELSLELNERSQVFQQADAVQAHAQQTAQWEKQKLKNELSMEFDAKLNDERAQFQEELVHRTRTHEAALKEKDAAVIHLTRTVGDLNAAVQTLTSQLTEAELRGEISTKQYDALKNQTDKTQQQLIDATKDAGEAISLRNRCDWNEAQLQLAQDRCRDLEGQVERAKAVESLLRQEVARSAALHEQADQNLAYQTDSALRDVTSKLDVAMLTNDSLRRDLADANAQVKALEKNVAVSDMSVGDWKRKCANLEAELRQSAVSADKALTTEDRVQQLELDISQLHETEHELRNALAVMQAEKAMVDGLLKDSDKKLTILQATYERAETAHADTVAKWQHQQQALHRTVAQDDAQHKMATQARQSELHQAQRLDWERELAQVQSKCRDETRKAELVQVQHTQALSKLARVESEYQHTLTDFIKAKVLFYSKFPLAHDSLKSECDRRGEHIRLLLDEVQQSRLLKTALEAEIRAAMGEQKPLVAKIRQLQGKLNDLESANNQASNDVHVARFGASQNSAAPDSHLVDRLDSLIKKSVELQEHTKRFQEKHGGVVWNDVMCGGKAMPSAMEVECKRLLHANGVLSQKVAQVL
ncbi:hypothetical protein DYB30_007566 [Aphanomyces astaci]|uniref:Centrosomin N-terminal motif 1 domain-containing protein n=1 Tax=Aphanomyces astaci TaxID=112090 RepID=A0A397CMR5_APHAT|nr:hypothetical protein DYB30_007566 [Aphanomyces astaci]